MNSDELMQAATVIPVVEIPSIDHAGPLAEALVAGGLGVVELTLRTECALAAISVMQKAAPQLVAGMGTIRTAEEVEAAVNAGASFLVSPGSTPPLLDALANAPVPSLPGVATASEALCAFDAGFKAQKFFPAEPAGGVAYLKGLAGPLADIVFCPTGGISAKTAPDYLALPNVACVGGSWIASRQLLENCDWPQIEKNAREAVSFGEQ